MSIISRWIVLLVLTSLVFCKISFASGPRQPNIVLFYVDDLGWSDLGYSGSSFYESPNIDRLANEGVVFDNAYAGDIASLQLSTDGGSTWPALCLPVVPQLDWL